MLVREAGGKEAHGAGRGEGGRIVPGGLNHLHDTLVNGMALVFVATSRGSLKHGSDRQKESPRHYSPLLNSLCPLGGFVEPSSTNECLERCCLVPSLRLQLVRKIVETHGCPWKSQSFPTTSDHVRRARINRRQLPG